MGAHDVVVRVSLSAEVSPEQTSLRVPNPLVEVDLSVPEPDVMWLRSPSQLERLKVEFGKVLRVVRRHAPDCERLHLFYAGPAGGAVVLGQALNPRMDPVVVTYEFSRQRTPQYRRAVVLEEPS